MNKGNVIAYEFRQLKTHEKNNFNHDLMLTFWYFYLSYSGIIMALFLWGSLLFLH